VLLVDAESRPGVGPLHSRVADMTAIGGQATAYVCEDYACQLPTADVAEFGSCYNRKSPKQQEEKWNDQEQQRCAEIPRP
jgi:uncharacterized protein YyaL (SSP411 family)